MRRLLCLPLAVMIGCVHAQPKPEGETLEAAPVITPLTPEASAVFSRAEAPEAIGSVLVDLDEMRTHGLIGQSQGGRSAYVDLLVGGLAGLAPTLEGENRTMVVRAAVLIGLLRAWDAWPEVQRAGIILPALNPSQPGQNLMLVLAVPHDAKTNLDLLRGIAAIDRNTGKPLFTLQNGRLCASLGKEADEKFGPVCAVSGPGYLLLASGAAIEDLQRHGIARPLPPASFLRIRANVPMFGRGEVVADWAAGLHAAVTVTPTSPEMADKAEKLANEWLKKLDETHASSWSTVEPVLQAAKTGLSQDPDAPPELKRAAAGLTVQALLDPENTYGQWRQSVHVTRAGSTVTLTSTQSEESFRRMLKQYNVMTTAAVVGVLSAIAIPNFRKFQKRSKQAEVKSQLRAIFTAQKTYYAENNHYGKTFAEIGFTPEPGTRYNYCMAGHCLPCTATDCFVPPPGQNKCIDMTREYANDDGSEGFLACALGDPDGHRDPNQVDIWSVTEDGQPQHVTGDGSAED